MKKSGPAEAKDADKEELLSQEGAECEPSKGEGEEDLTNVQDSESDDMSPEESEESEIRHKRRSDKKTPQCSSVFIWLSGG